MKIAWKNHELLLLIGTGTFITARNVLEIIYSGTVHYSFFIPYGAILIFFILGNNWIIPSLKKNNIHPAVIIITAFATWAVVASLISMITYFELKDPLQNPGATRRHVKTVGAVASSAAIILVSVYLYLRETIIHSLNKPGIRNAFRIMLVNRITLTSAIYLLVMLLPFIFVIQITDSVAIFYILILLPSLIVIFINIYFMGMMGLKKPVTFDTIWPFMLIVPGAICALISVIFIVMSQNVITYMIWIFLFMLLIINPLSWVVYRQLNKTFIETNQLQVDLGNTTANLQFLRTQINPHFLFNALNTIYGTAIQENAPRTSEAAQKLGDMMRFMLHENTQDHIALDREIEYLNNYISLQTLRTAGSDKIRIDTQIEENYHTHQVAPMLLIPFVENAFKHGISLQHNSWIRINLQTSENTLVFDVSNSIHIRGINDIEKDQSGIGLENVKQRLVLLYPDKHNLSIHHNNNEFFIHLTITLN